MTSLPSPAPRPAAPRPDDRAEVASVPAVHARLRASALDPGFADLDARRDRLARLAAVLKERRADLADAVRRDLGKGRAEAEISEVHPVRQEIQVALRHLARWANPRRVPTPATLFGTSSRVQPQPKGAVLILAPWNYPVNLSMMPLVPALAAGNAVAVKLSEKAPHTAEALRALIEDTFAPHEVAVFAGGPEVAEALLDLPWDHVFFTGSTRVGRLVMQAAAKHLTPVTLELGGKSPAIVDASADLDLAAERIVWGKLMNAGQTCVAPDYVLAHSSVAPALVAKMREVTVRLYGLPENQRVTPDYGRLVDEASLRRLAGLVADSVARGARVAFGGDANPAERYLAPTVLTDVTPDMPVMGEELFGPVLPVLTFDELGRALSFVRERDKPLALYAFGRDAAFQNRVARETTSGGMVVNGTILHLLNHNLPFGGVGASGQGAYHGEHGFRVFSHERAVLVEPTNSATKLLYPPYGRAVPRFMAWVLRLIS